MLGNRRFNRALVFVLAFLMVLSGLGVSDWGIEVAYAQTEISGSGTEGDPYKISSSEELASLGGQACSGYYQLTEDIDMAGVSMSPIKSLSGDLDGNGHTISNLTLSGSSNVGLIGELKRGSVKNLTLDALTLSATGSYSGGLIGLISGEAEVSGCSVKNSTVSSSASYEGGLIGRISSVSAGIVDVNSCSVEDTTVKNTYTSSAYVGGLVGDIYSSNAGINLCYVKGDVSFKGSNAGGFTGRVSSSDAKIENSYVTGNVKYEGTQSSPAGTSSFLGNVSVGSSYSPSISNCYFAGTLSNVNSTFISATSASSYSYITVTNSYFDSTKTSLTSKLATGKTTEEMQSADFAATLGGAYMAKPDDYPMLKWEDPNATYGITIQVEPIDAKLTFDGDLQEISANGVYSFSGFTAGTSHTYQVEQADDTKTDLRSESGTIVVGKTDIQKKITLSENTYQLKFNVSPSDAEFVLKDAGGNTVNPKSSENGSYTFEVINGKYTYNSQKFGYASKEEPVTVERKDATVDVGLQEKTKGQVQFNFLYDGKNIDVENFDIEVACGQQQAEVTNGKVNLYEGYDYQYVIRSKDYSKAEGTIKADSGTVTIELTKKTTWEGEGDIFEPEQEDGIYQISAPCELAWFAALVNGTLSETTQNQEAKAVLTKDIDLGSEDWTPIGNSLNYFLGSFDGQGHRIKNLYTEAGSSYTSNYRGLFGCIGSNGTATDLTIQGSVSGNRYVGAVAGYNAGTISNVENYASVSSASYYTGGIAGYNTGNIRDVQNEGSVTSTSYDIGGITGYNTGTISYAVNRAAVNTTFSTTSSNYGAGGIVGYDSHSNTNETGIVNCANAGDVTAEKMLSVGGIVGYASRVFLENVYNIGDITGKDRTGGLIGYASAPKISYAYNAGKISKVSGSYVGELIGYAYGSITAEGLYYNEEANKAAGYGTVNAETGITKIIGQGNFAADSQNQNNGYPILAFEDTTPKFDITFNINPVDATLQIRNTDGIAMVATSSEEGSYLYKLPAGEYTYSVRKFGKTEESGKFTVTDQPVTKEISLEDATFYNIDFAISPEDVASTITVKYGDKVLEATEAGNYSLPAGEYTYEIKAKGYSKAKGTFAVTDGSKTIKIQLVATKAWDGETLEMPELKGEIYQISTGEELAWFAKLVNEGTTEKAQDKSAAAVLTEDIDLGGNEWTPIGKNYSNTYAGDFDGNGFTVSGLKIESEEDYQGLFGRISGSTIENLIVDGEVIGNNNRVGGIVAWATGTFTIRNCGNLAKVTNQNTSGYAAGVLGYADGTGTLEGCYNAGTITSGKYASGIVSYMSGGTIKNCYNIGAISGGTAVGIAGNSSSTYTNCYNAGTITGTTYAYSIGSSAYATYASTYYLEGVAANDSASFGTSMREGEMKAASFLTTLGEDSWKADTLGMTNDGYPILSWQQQTLPTEKGVKLDAPSGLKWVTTGLKDALESGIDVGLALAEGEVDAGSTDGIVSKINYTTRVTWNTNSSASSYTVKLYNVQAYYEAKAKKETPQPVYTKTGITQNEYDFEEAFAAMDESKQGLYMFTVTAVGDGVYFLDSDESGVDGDGYDYMGQYALDAPTGLSWNENTKTASWNKVEKAEAYYVILYKDGQQILETLFEDFDQEAEQVNMSLIRNIETSGTYTFAVKAAYVVKEDGVSGNTNRGNIILSQIVKSPDFVYTSTEPEWIEISSAAQWIALANTTAAGTEYTSDADAQYAAWSKNYRLAEDIDFSNLTAEEESKTKSMGNANAEFTGIFDGNGHKITGLTLSNGDSGLFAYIGKDGMVKDITVQEGNVLFSDNAAVLCWMNKGTITDCAVINTNITADSGAIIGGMVSRNYGTITKSYVQGGTLTANSTTANGHAGFVGGNYGIIKQCYTTMDVTTKSYCAGGFAGWADTQYGNGECLFEDCFALGDVSAENGWSGGFVGRINDKGCKFVNCYTANQVTSKNKGDHAYGFTGALGSQAYDDITGGEGAFQIELTADNFVNCYYDSTLTEKDNTGSFASGKTDDQMKTAEFAETLGESFSQSEDKNSGLPYLKAVAIPEKTETSQITVKLLVATYNTENYTFEKDSQVIDVTMDSTGNTRVIDVMNAARDQGLLSYTYTISPAYGSFIESINGHALSSPDGWMFTINDTLSNVSASLARVQEGDKILWYEGLTQNLYKAPTWSELTGESQEENWTLITTAEELTALCFADDSALAGNYKLGSDIDLEGVDFAGIGSSAHPFTGTFDGDGHTIYNLTMTRDKDAESAAMFNHIKGAVIKNLNLVDASVTGGRVTGLLVGNAEVAVSSVSMAASIGNLIGNCSVSGKVVSLYDTNVSGIYAGGLIGFNDGAQDAKTGISIYSSVDNCKANVAVSGITAYVGGLAGGNFGYITNSEATGNVTGTNGAGGFVGGNNGGIYDSHSTGDVRGNSAVGGFAGVTTEAIENCYSTGNVYCLDTSGSKVGGFVGSGSGILKNSMSAGTVNSNVSYTGGFAGSYEGNLSGLEKDIQLSGCYGNCVAGDGTLLNPIGNMSSSTVESIQAVLDSMKLSDAESVSDKLFEMFGVSVDGYTKSQLSSVLASIYVAQAKDFTCDDNGPWVVSDLIAYESAFNKEQILTDAQVQSYINYVAEKAYETTSAGDLAKYIISLKALGFDATKVVTVNQSAGTYFDLVSKLKTMVKEGTGGSTSIYTMPYILMALQQSDTYADETTINSLIQAILDAQLTGGGWGYSYGGIDYADVDAVAPAVSALAKYYDGNEAVKAAIDKALDPEFIEGFQGASGAIYSSWSNAPSAESTGLVLSAISSVGKSIADYQKDGKTLVDGLMGLLNSGKDGFLYNGSDNAVATEQGFRGLLSAVAGDTEAYRIYDFSTKASNIAKATGSGSTTKPDDPSADTDITVYVTVRTDTETWLERSTVTVKSDAKVYHAFVDALAKAGMSQVGAADGYVKSITKDGTTLAEFDKGANSGWLYTVNGQLPNVPLTAYSLKNGDEILWYYTKDYTQDSAAGGMGQSAPTITLTDAAGNKVTDQGSASYDSNTNTVTITPAEGYVVKDVLVGGVSKGSVTTLSGISAGDVITVIFEAALPDDDPLEDPVVSGVSDTQIKLKSTLGTGYVKLTWTKSKGYKVDYYEVYRSTKRYSGYGKTPIFTTKTNKTYYKNTKGLKKGTRYYYKVRGVRVLDGKKIYTKYSNKAWRTVK